jgi:hypothetical protein
MVLWTGGNGHVIVAYRFQFSAGGPPAHLPLVPPPPILEQILPLQAAPLYWKLIMEPIRFNISIQEALILRAAGDNSPVILSPCTGPGGHH